MSAAGARGIRSGHAGGEPSVDDWRIAVRAFKRQFLEHALMCAGGNRTRAACRLGLQRTHLLRLIRELGVGSHPPGRS